MVEGVQIQVSVTGSVDAREYLANVPPPTYNYTPPKHGILSKVVYKNT